MENIAPIALSATDIYLDNSATTALSPAAKEAMLAAMESYGNPSSLHHTGQKAAAILRHARSQIAATLGVRTLSPEGSEIVFTSCGSEADSLALWGTVHAKPRRDANQIISTDSEHPAVENVLCQLEKEGWKVVRLSTRGGALDLNQLEEALKEKTFLVSLMMVNNETGAVYDLRTAFAMVKAHDPRTITHTDAVQGYLKLPLSPAALQADLVTLSAHKVHGPKGVGALYLHPALIRTRSISPFLLGGGQEAGLRSGTENIIGIAGFAAAAADIAPHLQENRAHMQALRDHLASRLQTIGITVRQSAVQAPHILNLTLPDIKSETMLHFLDARGICVSAGSACSSHGHKTSRALAAFGVTPQEADCSLRVSFCPENTMAEVDKLAETLSEGLASLIRIRR